MIFGNYLFQRSGRCLRPGLLRASLSLRFLPPVGNFPCASLTHMACPPPAHASSSVAESYICDPSVAAAPDPYVNGQTQ